MPSQTHSLWSGSNETGSLILAGESTQSHLFSFVPSQTHSHFYQKFLRSEADCGLGLRRECALFRALCSCIFLDYRLHVLPKHGSVSDGVSSNCK